MNEEKIDNSDDMPEFFLEKEEGSESSKKMLVKIKDEKKANYSKDLLHY